jgi:hypothetical protein
LGLFISKAVVQAHGGQIHAFNGHEEMVRYSILYYLKEQQDSSKLNLVNINTKIGQDNQMASKCECKQ